ncbi:hypothetical protein ABG768_013811 [Culter alburnus]|uniref:Uncharacterized protein n=1 Tax=Culter alburnus TaxID=194366 RepID=A0AAW1Z3S7_CULAL
MGCSPSKGQLFSKKALLSGSPESKKNADLPSDGAELQIKEEINIASEGLAATEIQENAKNIQVKEDATEKMLDVVHCQDGQGAQEGLLENQKEGLEEIRTKDKQGKQRKQRKQRLRKNSCLQSKAEFILKAHQAAYAYLNPIISKYESLLGLLSQAAQTQLSVQTTVATVVLHYEEINQALEEMAAEGEQLLREHGHNMNNDLNQLPSELLQQMLLHSTVKMISVGDSVKCLGDSALKELADYFGSLSQVLGEKLLAKHVAEERLKQVLSHVEAAALRKPGPEDSELHSEDSSIGADNECQNGLERFRRNRGSLGSGANTGKTSVLTTTCSPDQQLLNANEEGTDNDDEDDDDNDDDDDEDAELEDDVSGRRTMCGSFEANSSFPQDQGGLQNQDQLKLKHRHLRRPKRSQSSGCLCSKAEESVPNEEQGNLWNMQTPHWRRKNNFPDDLVHGGHVRTKIRKGSSGEQCSARYYGLQYGSKGPFRAVPPSSPPEFTPEPPGQGVEDNSRQSPLDQRPVRVRGNKKCTLPLLENRSTYHQLADKPGNLDIDSLQSPPSEMLMDNTFESGVGLPAVEGAHDSQCRRQQLHTLIQRETSAETGLQGSVPHQECKNHNEGETATMTMRTWLPPSCPTLHHPVPNPPSTTCPLSGRWTPSTTSTTSSISGSQVLSLILGHKFCH